LDALLQPNAALGKIVSHRDDMQLAETHAYNVQNNNHVKTATTP